MEQLFGILIVAIISGLIIYIPVLIADNRKVSENNRNTIFWLSVLGILFGITWIVAIIWACFAPGNDRGPRDKALNPKTFTFDNNERCENCGEFIGRLETPRVWKNHVICAKCEEKLCNP